MAMFTVHDLIELNDIAQLQSLLTGGTLKAQLMEGFFIPLDKLIGINGFGAANTPLFVLYRFQQVLDRLEGVFGIA